MQLTTNVGLMVGILVLSPWCSAHTDTSYSWPKEQNCALSIYVWMCGSHWDPKDVFAEYNFLSWIMKGGTLKYNMCICRWLCQVLENYSHRWEVGGLCAVRCGFLLSPSKSTRTQTKIMSWRLICESGREAGGSYGWRLCKNGERTVSHHATLNKCGLMCFRLSSLSCQEGGSTYGIFHISLTGLFCQNSNASLGMPKLTIFWLYVFWG